MINAQVEMLDANFPSNDQLSPEDLEHQGAELLARHALSAPIMKHPSFAEESEWRIISPLIQLTEERVEFRSDHSMLIPYYRFPLGPGGHVSVTVGPTPHRELSWTAVGNLLRRYGWDWQTTYSTIPYRNW